MQKDEAIKILARHLMQCGMLMPMEWVQKNGEDSEFMQAYKMAMDALENEPVRCKDCKHRGDDGHCPMCYEEASAYDDGEGYIEVDYIPHDRTSDDGFCDRGERREGE